MGAIRIYLIGILRILGVGHCRSARGLFGSFAVDQPRYPEPIDDHSLSNALCLGAALMVAPATVGCNRIERPLCLQAQRQ